jgi:hypothetical protein
VKITRRKFIKDAALMGTAIAVSPTILVRKARASWAPGTIVHPHVDNLRVVGIEDKVMTRDLAPVSSWARQDELVVKEAVWENIDKLACGLTDTKNPGEAWRDIFVKPPRKSWSDTVVAIKTNNIGRQHTRSAVMSKICHTLVQRMGVKGRNIHIYDGSHGESMIADTPFAGLPEGCHIQGTWGGTELSTTVGRPWKKDGGDAECLNHLVNGSVDILINVAMCKGHSNRFGGFTMTMKNHFGSFSPRPGHWFGAQDYLMAINQTREILGDMDSRTGKVLYPRQQLCIVDALWTSECGPGCKASHQPNALFMGVFSPVVDYQVATQFRGRKMGWPPSMKTTGRLLTEFGYSKRDLPAGGRIIHV